MELTMKELIFIALPVAGLAHVFEEYVYPGGFPEAQAKLLPRAVHLFTPVFHVMVNGVFLLLCLAGALVGKANLVFSLSVFSLVFTNALLHIRGSIIQRGYYPGVISAVLLYIPLAVYAYSAFLISGEMTVTEGVLSALLGILYMGSLMAYV